MDLTLTWTCLGFSMRWQTSMLAIHGWAMICSVVHLNLGLGSSMARIKGRHCLGERLAIVDGVAAVAALGEIQALA